MDTDDTRQPRSPEDYATMIMQLLGSETMADAYSKVSALVAKTPSVATDTTGKLYFAPMKVRDVSLLIAALENMQIK